MRKYFRYMASYTGRILRICIGVAILAWGYSNKQYPANAWLMAGGVIFILLAAFNISLLAPLMGLSIYGKNIIAQYGIIDGLPGEPIGEKAPPEKTPELSDSFAGNEKLQVKVHSTTQGGSNYGQGSTQLGADAYKQGSVKNAGANYNNETGKLSEENNAGNA